MAIFGKKNSIDKLRADLAILESRSKALLEQRAIAAANLDAAKAAARDALIAGDDRFDDSVVMAAERRLATVADAIDEIERRIEDAGAALAEAEDTRAREDEAKAREAKAAKIEAIAVRLERAIRDVATIAGELRDEIPDCLQIPEYQPRFGVVGNVGAKRIISSVVAEGLFSNDPELFSRENDGFVGVHWSASLQLWRRLPDGALTPVFPNNEETKFLPASGAVDALITSRLRDSAAQIRAGELPADAPATPAPTTSPMAEAAE